MAEDTRILFRFDGAPGFARSARRLRRRIQWLRLKLWLEKHRRQLAFAFALVYLVFYFACLFTEAWIDDSVYAALPWWSLVYRVLTMALAFAGARWLGQQMRRP